MKSVMTKDFSRVAQTDAVRSTFDRGHGLKTAFDSGYLIPVELQEVVPSDTVEFDGKFFARLAPAVTPVMDNVHLDLHVFFVPSRLIWNNFTKLMGERKNPKDSIDYLTPVVPFNKDYERSLTSADSTLSGCMSVGSLADYFGIPVNQLTDTGGTIDVSVLPFRAYAKIWDDWYRDENLQDSIIQSTDELGDSWSDSAAKLLKLRKRGKRHDYFTSSLPFPQKGEGALLPLGQTAPVHGTGQVLGLNNGAGDIRIYSNGNNYIYGTDTMAANGKLLGQSQSESDMQGNTRAGIGVTTDSTKSGLVADLSDATASTINSLRMAFQIQVQLERDARSGTRYCEIIRENFKTISPDARLQRSEYIAGYSQQIVFNPVAQTSATNDSTPQGNLVSNGTCFIDGFKFTHSFSEHGYLIILASVRCDLNYQQGLDRLWTRRSRFDFYWPAFAHLGEQAVLNKEIYAQGDSVVDENGNPVDDAVFGYQERYAEMRYNPSRITGKLRSGVNGSLDIWHLAQYFETLPVLSSKFIEDDPPLRRVLAVQNDEPEIILDSYLGQKWTRPIPLYSIPGLIDHL